MCGCNVLSTIHLQHRKGRDQCTCVERYDWAAIRCNIQTHQPHVFADPHLGHTPLAGAPWETGSYSATFGCGQLLSSPSNRAANTPVAGGCKPMSDKMADRQCGAAGRFKGHNSGIRWATNPPFRGPDASVRHSAIASRTAWAHGADLTDHPLTPNPRPLCFSTHGFDTRPP